MSGSRSLTAIDPQEYDRIEATMSESSRGRWFLHEYARRNRSADTDMLLCAIERLEGVVTAERPGQEPDRVDRMRGDLMDMANAIARTKAEIAAISTHETDQSRLGIASIALDAIVLATERATTDILGAAEHVQEAAWTLRESGSDGAVCDELDRRATQIYTACSFQDLTAQRTARIIHTLRYLEDRLAAMMTIWADGIAEVPPAPGERSHDDEIAPDLCQSDVDRFIDMDAPAAPSDTPASAKASLVEPRADLPDAEWPDDDVVFLQTPRVGEFGGASGMPVSDRDTGSVEEAGAPEQEQPLVRIEVAPATARTTDPAQESDGAAVGTSVASGKADVEEAFAGIDDLTPEERAALFS